MADPAPPAGDNGALAIAIDGWEGPLDLLLAMARTQKVDLRELSILALVEQYLAFVRSEQAVRLELAADYLVMAAWLAYLKSALLLPRDPVPDPDPEELAARLQRRLQRLDAMRDAGARLLARDRLGRDVFPAASPPGIEVVRTTRPDAALYDLIAAYGTVRARTTPVLHQVRRRSVLTLEDAIERVARLIAGRHDWVPLGSLLPPVPDEEYRRSALASTFVAGLELARQGRVRLAQDEPFAPIRVRAA